MGNAMSVLGDNVSNVNTIAFKSSRATFQDVLSQSVATAAGAAQVGRGVTMTTIDGIFAQGSFESTSTATDLAIGGQGFFMLRASGSAEADMYTRAGEFRFDNEGFLVNPTGNFVQGWTLDTTSGERQGTIGDINLGKTTPPVQTTSIQVIANVDSRKNNETTELRLYDAWNGTNPALPVPSSPIDVNAYEYTTAIKVYDSVGASHDLTVYFDRTSKDNEWEFLVTCEPSEDQRSLSTGRDITGALDGSNDEASIYTPDTAYNYQNHKGAGALLYGVLDFSTSGAISNMTAWNVPPDGAVDPSQSTNLLTLTNTDQYYSFAANFTGGATNQQIELNLGARYSGQSTPVSQILASDGAAYSSIGTAAPITKETLWNTVYDESGSAVDTSAVVSYSGYNHSGVEVSGSYTLTPTGRVQDLLDAMGTTFGSTCSIDAAGRLRMTDDTGGPSGLAVTSFAFDSGVNPFGGTTATVIPTIKSSAGRLLDSSGASTILATDNLTDVYGTGGLSKVDNGDVFTFAGNKVDGTTPAALVFTVGAAGNTTVQNLLDALATAYSVNPGDVTATLDASGYIVLTDTTSGAAAGSWTPTLTSTTHPLANPIGADAAVYTTATSTPVMYTDALATTPVAAGTALLMDTFDPTGDRVAPGDVFTVSGTANDGTAVAATTFTVTATSTVADLATFLDSLFDDGNPLTAGPGTIAALNAGTGAIDFTGLPALSITLATTTAGTIATPLGAGAFTSASTPAGGQINVNTSKQQVVSQDRGVSAFPGSTPITGNTSLTSVYDSSGVAIAAGDQIVFTGTRGDSTPVSATFIYGTSYGSPLTAPNNPPTMQDLLTFLETEFNAEATVDGAGRLVLTDRVADEVAAAGYHSALALTGITAGASGAVPFGTGTFSTVAADIGVEDGSRVGDTMSINFSTEALSTTQYANSSTTIFQDQNGFAAGFLQSVSVDTAGIITGNYSNGQVLERAQVALASFNNLAGLNKEGGNVFRETSESGAPITGPPATNGLGTISPNSLEQSNVDLGSEFVKLITTQRGFQANSKIITTVDEMLSDLINLKR